MDYDIPPELKHKGKILWSLTLSQIGYAIPAAIIIFFILFKTGLPLQYSWIPAMPVVLLAGFFMFFDGVQHCKDWYNHFRNPEIEVLSATLKEIVDIQKVKNDMVLQSNAKLAILEVIPMNFMLKTDEDKETVINGFQKFLNSLDFPIQVHISSNPISLKQHFQHVHERVQTRIRKLKKQKEGEEAINYCLSLVDDYCSFVRGVLEGNNIRNRHFYIIIKEVSDLAMQVKICTENLTSLGLKVRKLSTEQLSHFFHAYIAKSKKKKIQAEQVDDVAHFLYAPEKIVFKSHHFIVDDAVGKVLVVDGYPHKVDMSFLDKIISSGEEYDISIHIEPFPIDLTMVRLNRSLQDQRFDLYEDTKKGIINPSLEIKFKSTRKVLEDLQKGRQKLFNVSLYIMCKGKSVEEADLLAKRVKADLDGLMIQNKVPAFRSIHAYASMLPLANNKLNIQKNIHTKGLAAFFPFSSPFLDIQNTGILLGLNKNRIPVIKDVFSLTNANGICLATSGSGKSFFTKLMLSRQYLNGCDILIIDPQGEYLAITEHYKGESITISKNSDTIINPLDLMGHEYLEKRLSLMDMFQIMFGDLTEIQKAILDKAIDLTYARKDINRDTWKAKTPPKMQDLYMVMKDLHRNCHSQEKVTYRALLNRLRMYTEGGVFSFLNRDTNINFSKDFICFNIGNMPKQVKPLVMYLVLDYVYMRMKESLKRKLLVIDEAWAMLQTAEESSYVFEIVKTCRKYNLGLLMITQDVADLINSKAGHAVLANTSYTYLLRQKSAIMRSVQTTFNLSQAEKEYLLTADKGKGILIMENEHQELEVIASKKEHELITTNPDEMVKKGEKKKGKKKEQKDVNISLDLKQDVFLEDSLSIDDKNFLHNHDYVLGSFHNLKKGKQKQYFVKKKGNEGAPHTFYVDLIYKEIKKYTNDVNKYVAENADIIFINWRGEEVAIEVETGMKAKYKSTKDYHDEKFEARRKQFGDKCYIFLIQSKIKNSYLRHNLPILYRSKIKKLVLSEFDNYGKSTSGGKSDSTK